MEQIADDGTVRTGTVTEAFNQCGELSFLAEFKPKALMAAIQEGIVQARKSRGEA
jgi:hypothetical protein